MQGAESKELRELMLRFSSPRQPTLFPQFNNLLRGSYVITVPIMTANWKAKEEKA